MARVGLALARRNMGEALHAAQALPDSLCPYMLPRRLLRMQLLVNAGRDEEAATVFDHTPATAPEYGFGAWWGLAMLSRARIAERRHESAIAERYYARVLALWSHADPELRPYVDEARTGLARIGGHPKP